MPEASDAFRGKFAALVPLFNDAIYEADQGDRPQAFTKAEIAFRAMKDNYGLLQEMSSSPNAFRFVMEILGFNEIIGRYCQVGRNP